MFLKELLFDYETILSISILVVSISGVFWKMKIDLAKLYSEIEKDREAREKGNDEMDLKIQAINCDRERRWMKYEEKQEKQDAYQADILRGVNEINIKVEGMGKDILWLKEK